MKFSVIVPVYGVEKYLDECVRSILSQTYTDFEVLLVDDCSPDACPAMCDRYAEQDSRVKALHKPQNEGLGFARNTGLAAASGEYVLFVDSDDTIAENTLETCAAELSENTDILAFGIRLCVENKQGKVVRTQDLTPNRFIGTGKDGKAEAFARLTEERVFQYACNKAYNREFLKNTGVLFEQTKLIEDFLFNIAVFGQAREIRAIASTLYDYRKPKHETLASKYSPEFFALAKRKYALEKAYLETFDGMEKYGQLILEGYVKHVISAVIRNRSKSAALTKKEQKRLAQEMLDDTVTVEVAQAFVPRGFVYKPVKTMLVKKRAGCFWRFCGLIKFLRSM